MAENEGLMWGIHGGTAEAADTLFLKGGREALGWSKMGDLSSLKPDREAFKEKVAEVRPGLTPLRRVYVPEALEESRQ